jgi:diaminopimelate decarboxylase
LGIRLSGLHYFLGSQLRTLEAHAENLNAIAASVHRLGERWLESAELPILNVGGGFGIAQQAFEKEVSIEEVAAYYQSAIDEIQEICGVSLEPHLECGRWIFGPSGVFVSRVIDIKQSYGELFVIVESGLSGFSRPAFLWGEPHPLWVLGDPLPEDDLRCTVVGPTCLPGDVIGRNVRLPQVQIGDPIVVGLAGAYGYSMSALQWGSINPTTEILID